MINLRDLNIPITINCNLQCKYCFRTLFEKPKKDPELSEDMKKFLKNHSEGLVTLNGGEPLLYFDLVKEIFSYVPESNDKVIITNGTLFTPEIIDYINENDVEVILSHDGPNTEFLRGVDILKSKTLCKLIHNIKNLRICSVTTDYSLDIWENFFYIAKKIKRTDFGYFSVPLMNNKNTLYLVKNFDYNTYINTATQFLKSKYFLYPYHGMYNKATDNKIMGFSVLLNGDICSNIDVSCIYGNIFDDYATLKENALRMGYIDYCISSCCEHNEHCHFVPQGASEHTCRCRRKLMDVGHSPGYLKQMEEYMASHLEDIEKKYGWKPEYLLD